jgi:hypothetical protein
MLQNFVDGYKIKGAVNTASPGIDEDAIMPDHHDVKGCVGGGHVQAYS